VNAVVPRPARLRPVDVLRVGGAGLRARPLRVVLSALGIAIGIAAMVAVVGISASSRAGLDRTLDRLGTNLLTVAPGEDVLSGDPVTLAEESVPMIDRVGPVQAVAATGLVAPVRVFRNPRIPKGHTGSIAVLASQPGLLGVVGARPADGVWFNPATAASPAVVLGATAAQRLGVTESGHRVLVWLGDRWFAVMGILEPVELAPELDLTALVGWAAAERFLGFERHPTKIYCRSEEASVEAVSAVLARTVKPDAPHHVRVSRPSDTLAVKRATDSTFTALLLGLGAVALLVGGVGVANTMVISVMERKYEIGVRRSLGATRGQIGVQFLTEAVLLAAIGGAGGLAMGTLATAGYAATQDWPTAVPGAVFVAGFGLTVLLGAIAGLYPAIRAARLAPTEALTGG
jgi:putative ABC transport system permease protein